MKKNSWSSKVRKYGAGKRFFSWLLAFTMIFTLFPTGSLFADYSENSGGAVEVAVEQAGFETAGVESPVASAPVVEAAEGTEGTEGAEGADPEDTGGIIPAPVPENDPETGNEPDAMPGEGMPGVTPGDVPGEGEPDVIPGDVPDDGEPGVIPGESTPDEGEPGATPDEGELGVIPSDGDGEPGAIIPGDGDGEPGAIIPGDGDGEPDATPGESGPGVIPGVIPGDGDGEPEGEPGVLPSEEEGAEGAEGAEDEDLLEISPLDGGILAPGDQYTVTFLIEGDAYLTEFITEGGTVHYQGAPESSWFPPGYVSFLGWYTQGAPDDSPYNFATPVMADLNLYGRFSNQYLVQFFDGNGDVYLSRRIAQGGFATAPTQQEMDAMPLPQGKYFDFWSLNAVAPYSPYQFGAAPITADTNFYPALTDRIYVYFVSYGSEVLPLALKPGDVPTRPADPTRDNYRFNHWTVTPGGDGVAYNFTTPITADLTLYASWTGIPNSVTYKVVWWLEIPDLNVSGGPKPGTASHYDYAASEIRTGTPGTMVKVESLPNLPRNADGSAADIYNPLYYAQFQSCADTTVSGANNTIVNVYLTRKVYRITFDLGNSNRWLRFGSSSTYYGSQYYIDVKYEQNISDIWPCTMTATFSTNLPSAVPFRSWIPPSGINSPTGAYWLTRRNVLTGEMMPTNLSSTGYTLTANYQAFDALRVRYWLEALPQQTGTSRTYGSKTYIVDRQYDQDNVPVLQAKGIQGTLNVGGNYSDSETGQGYEIIGNRIYQNFYYDRNRHTLIYDMGGGPAIAQVPNIMYGMPLAQYQPAAPTRPGYIFRGWFKDSEHTLAFDFANSTMPANTDLTVFALWESTDNTVSFFDGSTLLGTQGVANMAPVNFNNLQFNGVTYDTNLHIPGKGAFVGWLYYPPGSSVLSPFPVDLLIYSDTNLYVNWRTDGFRVTYRTDGSGAGSTAPSDPREYAMGTYARILGGNMIAPSSGLSFIGWRVNGAGITYYPGSSLQITGDMVMYPYFAPEVNITNITFNKNYPSDPENIDIRVEQNSDVPLPDEGIFARPPQDAVLSGWSSSPTGPVQYNKYSTYHIGNGPVTLYAIWESNNVTITYDGNGDIDNTLVTRDVPRYSNQNIITLAPTGLRKVGKDFLGWSRVKDDPNSVIPNTPVSINDNMTVYALWSTYDVNVKLTFDGNGDIDSTMVTVDVLIYSNPDLNALGPKNLIRLGYDQDGWSTARDDASTKATTIQQISADRTVYAFWGDGPISVTITFNGNGDDANTVYPVQVLKHTMVKFADYQPANLNKSGSRLIGWSTTANNPATEVVEQRVSANMTVYALWQAGENVNVIFDGNGGVNRIGAGQTSVSVPVPIFSTQTLTAIQPSGDAMFRRSGYTFRGWTTERDNANTLVTTLAITDTNRTVYALWASANDVKLIFDANGGQNRLGNREYSVDVPVNSTQILAEKQPAGDDMFTRAGYNFKGWSRTQTGTTTITEVDIEEENVRVYAVWEAGANVNLIFNGNGGRNGNNQTTFTRSVQINQRLTLSTVAPSGQDMFTNPGYEFAGWARTQDANAQVITEIDIATSDVTVYAKWQSVNDVQIIFNANTGADRNGNTTYIAYVKANSGQVQLSVYEPKGDFVFRKTGYNQNGWVSTAAGTTPITTVTIGTGNVTVYAYWVTGANVNLIFNGNGGRNQAGNSTFTRSVQINQTLTLSTVAPSGADMFTNPGFEFDGWAMSADPGEAAVLTVEIVTSNVNVYAKWKAGADVQLIFDANGGADRNGLTEHSVDLPINSGTVRLSDHEPKNNDMFWRTGYNFIGWSATAGGTTPITTVNIQTQNVRVYAIWQTGANVNLIFNGNGGRNQAGNTTFTRSVQINQILTLSTVAPSGADMFTNPGFEFDGWAMSADPGAAAVLTVEILTSNVNVYAKWRSGADVQLIFNANGGEDRSGRTTYSVDLLINSGTVRLSDHEPKDDDAFRRTGFNLIGWATSANSTTPVTTVNIATSSVTVYAIWEAGANVNLVFNGNGGRNAAGASTVTRSVQINQTLTLSTVAPTGDEMFTNPGYEFLGWTTTLDPQAAVVTTVEIVTSSVVVYAKWRSGNDVQLVFDANSGADRNGRTEYSVDFRINTGTVRLSDWEPSGNSAFRKTGYRLLGWAASANSNVLITEVDILMSSIRVYAVWEAGANVNLIFNGNGGRNAAGNSTFTRSVQINQTLTLADEAPAGAEMFTRPGYEFIGWTATDDPAAAVILTVEIEESNVNVYAKWRIGNDVKLIFNANTGADRNGNTVYSVDIPINTGVVQLSAHEPSGQNEFRKTGYNLKGWSLSPTGTTTIATVNILMENVTVYAVWEAGANVSLIFNGNGGRNAANETTYTRSVQINQTVQLSQYQPTGADMFTYPGHVFMGWGASANSTTVINEIDIITSNVTVYAIWESRPNVSLIFDGNGGRNAAGNESVTRSVLINSTQIIAEVQPSGADMFTRAGYNFLGWTTTRNVAGTLVGSTIDIGLTNVTLYALWSDEQHVLLIFNGNGGVNRANNDTFSVLVPINSTQTLSEHQPTGNNMFRNAGYRFDGWSTTRGNANTKTTTVNILTTNVTVYALWVKGDDVNLTFRGNGGVNQAGGDTYTVQVEINSTVTLSNLEPRGAEEFIRLGYDLTGWSTTANDESTRRTTLDIEEADATVYALWSDGPIYIDLTFDGNGDAAGTVKVVPILKHSNVTLSDHEPKGIVRAAFNFDGWTTTRNSVSTRITTIARLIEDTRVYAYWSAYARSDTPNIDRIEAGDDIVTGQGVPGSRIDVTWPNDDETFTYVDAGGNWAIAVPPGLTLVINDIVSAIQTENQKLPSWPAQETVGGGDKPGNDKSDTPDINTIYSGARIVTGRGIAGSKIEVVFEGATAPVIVYVQGDDRWTANVPANINLVKDDIVLARQTTGDKEPSDWAQRTVIDETQLVSDTPNINAIMEGDRIVRGAGVPGSRIEVTWPNRTQPTVTYVDANGLWTVQVPADVNLILDDIVTAVQTENNKLPSVPAHETVGRGPGDGKSDTPDIDVIYAGDITVSGDGEAGSQIIVRFPDDSRVNTTVGNDDRWSVNVPSGLTLVAGDEVFALQRTGTKDPSDWAQRTVIDRPVMLRSDTPNIDEILAGDRFVSGQGVPGSKIDVTWPGGSETTTYVDVAGNWVIDVPAAVTLYINNIVSAVQTENNKLPSIPAHETVGGGDKPGDDKSDTPDIAVIYAGDRTVRGRGTAGSDIYVMFPGIQTPVRVVVDNNNNWIVNVPASVDLEVGDEVFAQQITGTKQPSDWAQRTVIGEGQLISDTPTINRIRAGARSVSGEGVPGASIAVAWPRYAIPTVVTVDRAGNWTAPVPAAVNLVLDDVVTAVQTENGKLPSIPAHETVGGGHRPGDGKSDTPDIDVIYSGADKVTGVGTAGSIIRVRFPDDSTVRTTVDAYDLWTVDVPANITLVAGDEVFALQITGSKRPSDWAQRTVIDEPVMLISDTPNIDRINAGARSISGQGVPTALIEITWPNNQSPGATRVYVDVNGNWNASVPAAITLAIGQVVSAVQTENGKLPSIPATEVVGGNPVTRSDTPDIDVIVEGDMIITGRGTPGSEIGVKLPNWADLVYATVGQNYLWSVNVPSAITLVEGDVVFAQQTTPDKLPSDWAQRTVISEAPTPISDTPNIDPITEGDTLVHGSGVPGSDIEVTWPNNSKTATVVDSTGVWSVRVPNNVSLVEGDVVSAIQTEQNKLPSIPATETVGGGNIGPHPSDTPDIYEIFEHATVITGGGTAGSTITVRFPDNRTAETTVGANDRWSVNVLSGIDLLEGDIVFAMQTTPGKDPSAWAQRTVIAEHIIERSDVPNIDSINAGDRVVSGQGVPGSEILVTWPNNATTITHVDANRNWTAQVPANFNLIVNQIVYAVQTEQGKLPSLPAQETVGGVPVEISDTPDVDVIYSGDRVVTGRGVPGSTILVRFKNNNWAQATVRTNGLWTVNVPSSVTLVKDDVVYAQQTTGNFEPSEWVQRTVIDRPTQLISDTPNINKIIEGAATVTGEGVPGSEIEVFWPNNRGSTKTIVAANGNWGVGVPANLTLVAGDIVSAIQTEIGKLPSVPAYETVEGALVEYSDTPDINDIYEGDTVISGRGMPGSIIRVRLPDGRIIETTVGANEQWSVNVPSDTTLVAGQEVSAQQITGDFRPSEWAKVTVRARPTQLISDTPNIDKITAGDRQVTGQGVPGALIEVTWPNGNKTTTTVRGSGNWGILVPAAVNLQVGQVVTAIQTETGKLPSEPATEVVGDVPAGKSSTPDINVIYVGDTVVTGRGTPGSTITVKFENGTIVNATVSTLGLWSVNVPASVTLALGDVVYAQQKTGNNEPSEWAQRTVIARPAREISDTPNINKIDESDRSVTGEGIPGAAIVVTWPNGSTSQTTVNQRGNWSVAVPASGLRRGNIVSAVQTEPGKDPSWPAHEVVSGAPPVDNESDTPDIDVIYSGATVITGTGIAGSAITVRFPDGRTVVVTVGADDRWSAPVPSGINLVAGNIVEAMQRTLTYLPSEWAQRTVIDFVTPPLISDTPNVNPINEGDSTVTGEGVPGADITVTWPNGTTSDGKVDRNGNWTVRVPRTVTLRENNIVSVTQTEPGKLESEPAHVTVGGGEKPGDGKSDTPNIDEIVEGDRIVNGNGVPGSEVTVRFKNNSRVRATVQANRLWTVNVPASVNLLEGDIVLAVQVTGTKLPSDEAQRTVIKTARPRISDTPNIDPVKDTDKVVTGQGVPGSDIKVTWPDGVKTTETKVGPDGNWAVAVPDDVTLREGDIITAVQTEPGKPESDPAHETVNGDTKTGPGNDGKSDTPDIDVIYVGATVVTGRGTPGSEVVVKFRNGATVRVIVGADTKWSVNVPVGLPMLEGDLVYAQQLTEGKEPSDWAQRTVIRRGGPEDPDVNRSDTPNINPIMDTDIVVTGEGVRGARITVTWKNNSTTQTTVDSRGRWAVAVPAAVTLIEGDIVTAIQKEPNKLDSLPAHETVNGDTKTGPGNDGKSDTPDIDEIYPNDTTVKGAGTPGSSIVVRFKDGRIVTTTVGQDSRWSVNVPQGLTLAVGDKVFAMQLTPGKTPSDWAQRTVINRPGAPNQSDTPNVNPIFEGDREVSGTGVPGSKIDVTWPDGTTSTTTVEPDGKWKVNVPSDVDLVENDIVTVVQTETGKLPSIPHHETVGGGNKPGDGKSDTPNINDIYEGDTIISGTGTPGSEIVVRFPGGKTVHTPVQPDGKWSVNVPDGVSLKAGDEVFALQSTPGKELSDWAQKTVLAQKTKSDQPTVNPIKEGDRTVTGEGKPGAKIIVTWPDGSESSVIVGGDGKWTVNVPDGVTLRNGDKVSVVQVESGKAPSDPVVVTVQAGTPPPTPPGGGGGGGGGGTPSTPAPPTPTPTPTPTPGTGSGRPGRSGAGAGAPVVNIPEEEAPLAGFIADHIQYIKGYPGGTVGPEYAITRAETAEIIYRLLEASRASRNVVSPFPDVPMNEWYTISVSYLASINIIRGYPDGTFKPDNPITRAEFATMISGFDKLEQVDYNRFPDVEGHWAAGYINSAAEKGWVAGYLDGMFRPEEFITRAEVISVINRMLRRKIEIDDIPFWAPSYTDLSKSHWAYADIIEASIGHRYERKEDGLSEIWTTWMREND